MCADVGPDRRLAEEERPRRSPRWSAPGQVQRGPPARGRSARDRSAGGTPRAPDGGRSRSTRRRTSAGREHRVARRDGAYGVRAARSRGASFSRNPLAPAFMRVVEVLVEVEGGEHQHLSRRPARGEQLPGGGDAVEAGHPDVHQHHVRRAARGSGERLGAVRDLADDLEVVLGARGSRRSRRAPAPGRRRRSPGSRRRQRGCHGEAGPPGGVPAARPRAGGPAPRIPRRPCPEPGTVGGGACRRRCR